MHRVNSLNFLQHPSDKTVPSSVSAHYSIHASTRATFLVGRVDGTSGLPHLQCSNCEFCLWTESAWWHGGLLLLAGAVKGYSWSLWPVILLTIVAPWSSTSLAVPSQGSTFACRWGVSRCEWSLVGQGGGFCKGSPETGAAPFEFQGIRGQRFASL